MTYGQIFEFADYAGLIWEITIYSAHRPQEHLIDLCHQENLGIGDIFHVNNGIIDWSTGSDQNFVPVEVKEYAEKIIKLMAFT